MDLQLKGKLAIVTGSTAGIGFASARALAAEGARVVVNGRTEARVAEAAEKIRREHPAAELELFAVIETNFLSGVRLSRGWLPKMKAAGWGRIIFISSESAVNIPPEMIHYGVTKTMQIALARGLAETTAGTGVTVNTVLAGPTRSEGVEKFLVDMAQSKGISVAEVERGFFRTLRPSSLLQRFASVDEVAAMVTFLASPLASATNGAAVRAEGGVVRSIL